MSSHSDPHSQDIKSWLVTMRIVSCQKVFSYTSLHELKHFVCVTLKVLILSRNTIAVCG